MDGRAGVDFPGSAAARRTWFPDDGACLDYLDWLRWGAGFACPRCDGTRSWRLPDGRRSCAACGHRASPTAGTVLHRARAPLPTWFAAAWELTAEEPTASVTELQRRLGLRSHQTAWAMVQRYRLAMGNHLGPGLLGDVQAGVVDIRVGPLEVAVAVAVEDGGAALGRCRLRVAGARPAAALGRLVREVVEPGAAVCVGRRGAVPTRVGEVADVVEAWLQGPLHGAVSAGHLQGHLDEVAFRVGGRGQRQPGALFARLLRQAVATGPVRAAELVHRAAPRRAPTVPPVAPVLPPPRTGTLLADRPWRAA